ncbi:relaxase/mobilization nuclease domain-containing protein [Janthinobacterium sp. FW305-128]|uniref:relaxase/mobilization nuclease domain-containing protein n=1 Tax=Janthinobacterium sp. FW305-128 TaxID=2775055 RepID=UPI001E3785AC|nr:relaxase/mobilization nuclease domain-containing protein [Janthinobacterium sp. FW305-128]MCC7684797.1 relaxase/mobilization nuclease domain-containing protein [Janthinobacterium sp. FW305-128]
MAIIAGELEKSKETPVKRKNNNARNLRSSFSKSAARDKALRVVSGTPEVMVKITGFGKGGGHIEAHVKYISRHGKVELENDRGDLINGKDEIKELFSDWADDFKNKKRHKEQRDTVHLFFSMPPGTDPDGVRGAVRNLLKSEYSHNHEYVFALHTDQPHPHVHAAIKIKGFDGTRLRHNRDDLQSLRESFAAHLRLHDIDAEATPRQLRGVIQKPEKLVIRHIELGDKTHPPRVSKIRAKQTKEIAQEIVDGRSSSQKKIDPLLDAIKKTHVEVREKWIKAAKSLLNNEVEDIPVKFNVVNPKPNYDRAIARSGFPRGTGIYNRIAELYQSDIAQATARPTAPTIASVRNMPDINVVYHRDDSKMLLQSDAPRSMGSRNGRRHSDHAMRRPRIGIDGIIEAAGRGLGAGANSSGQDREKGSGKEREGSGQGRQGRYISGQEAGEGSGSRTAQERRSGKEGRESSGKGRQNSRENVEISGKIVEFVESMPPVMLRREVLKQSLLSEFAHREKLVQKQNHRPASVDKAKEKVIEKQHAPKPDLEL